MIAIGLGLVLREVLCMYGLADACGGEGEVLGWVWSLDLVCWWVGGCLYDRLEEM